MKATALNVQSEADTWYLDSGATMHMCNDRNQFNMMDDTKSSKIYTATEEKDKLKSGYAHQTMRHMTLI